jgi:hypothetical protein
MTTNMATLTPMSALSAVEIGPGPKEERDEPYNEEGRRMFRTLRIVSLAGPVLYPCARHLGRGRRDEMDIKKALVARAARA